MLKYYSANVYDMTNNKSLTESLSSLYHKDCKDLLTVDLLRVIFCRLLTL